IYDTVNSGQVIRFVSEKPMLGPNKRMYRSSFAPSPMVKRIEPLVTTAAHGIPGASVSFTTAHFAGSIAYTRRRSRDPIHSSLLCPSHANACGVTAGETNRRCWITPGSFNLLRQYQLMPTKT